MDCFNAFGVGGSLWGERRVSLISVLVCSYVTLWVTVCVTLAQDGATSRGASLHILIKIRKRDETSVGDGQGGEEGLMTVGAIHLKMVVGVFTFFNLRFLINCVDASRRT